MQTFKCPFCGTPLETVDEKTKRCTDPHKRGCGFLWRRRSDGLMYSVRESAVEAHARRFFEIMYRDLA